MKNKNKIFRVVVLTPYLSEEISYFSDEDSNEKLQAQIEKYKLDLDNLNSQNTLVTPNKIVSIESPSYSNHGRIPVQSVDGTDFIIAGNTREGEEEVRFLSGQRNLIARYSIFYGRSSEYTGNNPEDVGYSFDIPKNVNTVRSMLTDDYVLDSIVSREEKKIVESIDKLNLRLNEPVIITPYLSELLGDGT